MEATVKERLIRFIAHKNISQRRFEMSIGVSNGYINSIRTSIQPDKVQSIALQYPELNTGWLLTGEGSMLRTDAVDANTIPLLPKTLDEANRKIIEAVFKKE